MSYERKRSRLALNAAMLLSSTIMTGTVRAQSFNVDFCGNFGWVASTSYGAAAGQPGVWNEKTFSGGPVFGLNGLPISVTMTPSGLAPCVGKDDPGTSGNDEELLDDSADIGAVGSGSRSQVITGLEPGNYQVFTYAWGRGLTVVDVNDTGPQEIGGAWPGNFSPGVTHALHSVNIAAGQDVTIQWVSTVDFGSANGFQIREVLFADSFESGDTRAWTGCPEQTCDTYTFDCNPREPTCTCITTATGVSSCIDSIQACGAPCPGGNADCVTGEVCVIGTCCGGPVCAVDVCPFQIPGTVPTLQKKILRLANPLFPGQCEAPGPVLTR